MLQYYQAYYQLSSAMQPPTQEYAHAEHAHAEHTHAEHVHTEHAHAEHAHAEPATDAQPLHKPETEDTTKSGKPQNSDEPDKESELHEMQFDVTSQMYYLPKKEWYYDPSTALYLSLWFN